MSYPMRCILALDLFANVILGGSIGETMSSRAARIAEAHAGRRTWNPVTLAWIGLNQMLLWVNYHHGIGAQMGDTARAEAVVKLEASAVDPNPKRAA